MLGTLEVPESPSFYILLGSGSACWPFFDSETSPFQSSTGSPVEELDVLTMRGPSQAPGGLRHMLILLLGIDHSISRGLTVFVIGWGSWGISEGWRLLVGDLI